jgi:LEA14-like dessication related protein
MKILLFLTLLLATSCSTIVEKPTVNLKDVRFAGLDSDGVSIDFLLSVTNTNSFDIPLNGYVYDVRLMALPLARGESKDSVTFYGNSSSDMLIPVRIAYSDVVEILKRRPGLKEIPYQLNADLDVGTPLGNVKVPVRKNGNLSVPEKYRPGNLLRQLNGFLKGT